MKGWTCESVQNELASNVRQQRGDAVPFLQYADANGNGLKLADTRNGEWMAEQHSSGEKGKGAPKLAPTYWGVKDGHPNSPSRQAIAKATQLPYFLRKTSGNNIVFSSPEFWFSVPGAGAKAHQDSHCQSTMSITLSGRKRWRLSPTPAVHTIATTPPLHDGTVNTTAWSPMYEFELSAGEGVFFPTGFVHETFNVGDGCSASVTFQFDYPTPAAYLKAYAPRLMAAPNMQECRFQQQYITANGIALGKQISRHSTSKAAAAAAERLFQQHDANADGAVSEAELGAVVKQSHGRGTHATELIQNAMAFHDPARTGSFKLEEFRETYVRWWGLYKFNAESRNAMRNYRMQRQQAKCARCDQRGSCQGPMHTAERVSADAIPWAVY